MSNAQYKMTVSATVTTKQVNSFIKRTQSLKADLPVMMASLVCVALKHRNVNDATVLINGLKETRLIRANKLVEWLESNGPFLWDKGEKKFTLDRERHTQIIADVGKKDDEILAHGERLAGAFELVPEQEFKGFDFPKRLKQLMQEAAKVANDDDKMAHVGTNMTGFNEIRSFLATNTAEDKSKAKDTPSEAKQIETTVEAA